MTQGPVSNLSSMLAGMEPSLYDLPYRFVALPPDEGPRAEWLGTPFGMIREEEGLTLIAEAREPETGIDPLFARITLRIHSSLDAVGLTAAVSTALAEAGIACNVVAGFHHDHLFVPWTRRDEALRCLQRLSQDARR